MQTDGLYSQPRHVERPEDCRFYHVMEIPGCGLVGGDWDLRGREREYLGHVELESRRVLEIGPASGFLTFYMESRGAEVVAVELAPDVEWDVVPHARLDIDEIRAGRPAIMERLRNSFWFAHERFGSAARVHYGSAYRLPDALGHFDIAVLGSVLLHVRDPLAVLEQCARRADCLVIADVRTPELDGRPIARLEPAADSDVWHTWWRLSPELLVQYLGVLGFANTTVGFHDQVHIGAGQEFVMPMFTVVANRSSDRHA